MPFTNQEIKKAIFSINVNKSPDPDGYGGVFFRAAWGIVGADVCKAIQEFFLSNRKIAEIVKCHNDLFNSKG